ncbi:MAG: thiolase family protein [Clostridia bacterium]|nr:thiolase family protein [Clostridia bacterium]
MRNAVLVSAVRTPVGKRGGVFKTLQRLDLSTPVVKEALSRAQITSEEVEENIWGNIPFYLTPSRYVWLTADGSVDTGCLTVNRGCGTGLAALTTAGALIKGGFGEIYTCGGVEQDSRPAYYLHNNRPFAGGSPYINTLLSSPVQPYGNPEMVQTAENVANKLGITREECDAYAYRSQMLAAKGYEEGLYQEHIVPITVPQKKADPIVVDKDEMFRPETTLEGLAKLDPVMGGVVTAGNASPLNDGAACAVMMDEELARAKGLKPLMRFIDFTVTGIDPRYMGLGPVEAMKNLMKRNKMEFSDLDFIECNEAFAAQTLGVIRELNLDIDKVNIRGGGIALGHPYSATGINLAAKAAGIFKRQGGERCAITFCVGGGQGIAALFENCD